MLKGIVKNQTHVQFFRFGAVGIVSNILLYALYLLLTWLGLPHKSSMTIAYVVGFMQSFALNRSYTFRYVGHSARAFAKFFAVHSIGYFLNLAGLLLLVDLAAWRHEIAQGLIIPVVAVFVFFGQKHWVFRSLRTARLDG